MRNTDDSGKTLLTSALSELGAVEVVPERLLDDHPAPPIAVGLVASPDLDSCSHTAGTRPAGSTGRRRGCRRCRARRRAWPACPAGGRRRRRRRKCPGRSGSPRPAGPRPPGGTGCGRAAGRRRRTTLAKSSSVPVPAGEADQRELGRQQPAVGQVVDRGHQLLAGQVAGDAEDHHRARPRDPRQPLVALVPQRVLPTRRRRCGRSLAQLFGCCVELTLRSPRAVRSRTSRTSRRLRSPAPGTRRCRSMPTAASSSNTCLRLRRPVPVTVSPVIDAVVGDGVHRLLRHGVDRVRARPAR